MVGLIEGAALGKNVGLLDGGTVTGGRDGCATVDGAALVGSEDGRDVGMPVEGIDVGDGLDRLGVGVATDGRLVGLLVGPKFSSKSVASSPRSMLRILSPGDAVGDGVHGAIVIETLHVHSSRPYIEYL